MSAPLPKTMTAPALSRVSERAHPSSFLAASTPKSRVRGIGTKSPKNTTDNTTYLVEITTGCAATFTDNRTREYHTGLWYFRARYFDSELGRFISRDPIGYQDGMNLYEYTRSNAFGGVDPTGLIYAPGWGDYHYYWSSWTTTSKEKKNGKIWIGGTEWCCGVKPSKKVLTISITISINISLSGKVTHKFTSGDSGEVGGGIGVSLGAGYSSAEHVSGEGPSGPPGSCNRADIYLKYSYDKLKQYRTFRNMFGDVAKTQHRYRIANLKPGVTSVEYKNIEECGCGS